MCPEDTYKCKESTYCLAWDYICDGIEHCPLGDDEAICDKCIRNEYKCLDGTQMSCELSCTILGFIPCTKYRNRVTCTKYYPNALGAYFKTNSHKGNYSGLDTQQQTKILYICGIISIFVFILFILLILGAIYKNYNKKLNLKSPQQQQQQQVNSYASDKYKQKQQHNDDEHKYQEINEECLLDDHKDDIEQTQCTSNDNYYKIQIVPPPYNAAHLFESINFNSPSSTDFKSTYKKTTSV